MPDMHAACRPAEQAFLLHRPALLGLQSTTKRRLRGQLLNSECETLVHDFRNFTTVCFHHNVPVSLCGNELNVAKQDFIVTQDVSMRVGKRPKACFVGVIAIDSGLARAARCSIYIISIFA